jgi:Na+/alanine symporter
VFALCIPIGASISPNAVWNLSDFAIAALTTINLTVLILMRREIRSETLLFFKKKVRNTTEYSYKTSKVDKNRKT